MKPSEALAQHRESVIRVIDRYSVSNPRVFGSVSRGDDTEESDLDILVDPSEVTDYFELFDLEFELYKLLDVRVEIVLSSELRPHVQERVMPEAIGL